MSSTGSRKFLVFSIVWLLILGGGVAAYKFLYLNDQADNAGGGVADPNKGLPVPFILWGGDVATFHANGGLETRPGTIFARHGLKLKLVRGDDFDKQVKDYLAGKTPFLRGTMSMLGQASEKIGKDAATRPVVFLQLTWSAGDHLVARAGLKTLADLKGKKIALQKGGPHVGMLNDILDTAKLTWKDINVVWTEDVTGPKGPESLFRDKPSIDACFVITPDMIKLSGGLDQQGTGVRGTVEGAHVLTSTKTMSRSIADVYACRKDFYDKHKDLVEKFAAGYLKACEELENLKRDAGTPYKDLLKQTQAIYGKEDIPDEEAADGLVADAAFVDLPGNISFFTDLSNPSGFKPKMKAALDLAIALGDASRHYEFLAADFDYNRLRQIGELARSPTAAPVTIKPNVTLPTAATLQKNTLYSFDIHFAPEQSTFPAEQYGDQFKRAVEQGSLFGKGVIAVRGHSDLANLLITLVREGTAKKIIRREGTPGQYRFYLADDSPLNLSATAQVTDLIRTNKDRLPESHAVLESCITLSQNRAEEVRKAVIKYAQDNHLRLDENQIVAVGAGVQEPASPTPRSEAEMARNRRVEFRLIKVSTEAFTSTGVNY